MRLSAPTAGHDLCLVSAVRLRGESVYAATLVLEIGRDLLLLYQYACGCYALAMKMRTVNVLLATEIPSDCVCDAINHHKLGL